MLRRQTARQQEKAGFGHELPCDAGSTDLNP
jgi:hypothetical protein